MEKPPTPELFTSRPQFPNGYIPKPNPPSIPISGQVEPAPKFQFQKNDYNKF